jgi:hypothetical protein
MPAISNVTLKSNKILTRYLRFGLFMLLPLGAHFVSLQFLNLRHSVRHLGRVISPSQGRCVTQTQNTLKHRQTAMPRVGFQPMIPVFERAKTVHALDRAATVNKVVGGLVKYTVSSVIQLLRGKFRGMWIFIKGGI